MKNILENHCENLGRFKEHLKLSSPINDSISTKGHPTIVGNFSIAGREDQNLTRTIKEAIYIGINNPPLTRTLASTICHMYGIRFCLTPQKLN